MRKLFNIKSFRFNNISRSTFSEKLHEEANFPLLKSGKIAIQVINLPFYCSSLFLMALNFSDPTNLLTLRNLTNITIYSLNASFLIQSGYQIGLLSKKITRPNFFMSEIEENKNTVQNLSKAINFSIVSNIVFTNYFLLKGAELSTSLFYSSFGFFGLIELINYLIFLKISKNKLHSFDIHKQFLISMILKILILFALTIVIERRRELIKPIIDKYRTIGILNIDELKEKEIEEIENENNEFFEQEYELLESIFNDNK